MLKKIIKLKSTSWHQTNTKWDILICFRLYIVTFLIIYPLAYFIIIFGYLSMTGYIILGIVILFFARFVLFERRKNSAKYLKLHLIGVILIITNFLFALLISIIHWNITTIFVSLTILICSGIYFLLTIKYQPFKKINLRLLSWMLVWSKLGKYFKFKQKIFKYLLIFWLILSISLITVPYPIYIQKFTFFSNDIIRQNSSPKTDFGIWTYGQSLNDDNKDEPYYIDNKTLKMLGNADVYFVYGVNKKKIGSDLYYNIIKLRDHGIKIHISVNPTELSYTNIWTFEKLRDDIEEILDFLNSSGFLGDLITTLVYDMEMLRDQPFPLYNLNPNIISKMEEYNKVQKKFIKFNDRVRKEYGLKIRIVSDINQAIDHKDGDDDLMNLAGLMSYEKAKMSYMVYRRYMYGQNQIIDYARFLKDGDTIILNAWKDIGYLCWEDIKCAIADSRLVLGYPLKTLRLEIWDLSYFLYSFGTEGLYDLVEALNEDSSKWPVAAVWNEFPYSSHWDINFLGIIMLDLYAPLFRVGFKAY